MPAFAGFFMSRLNHLAKIGDDFLSLLFPRVCQSCGERLVRNERVLCMACLADIPFTSYHSERENNLEKELWGRCYVEKAAAMCYYRRDSKVQKLIHSLKYYGIREIGIYLGEYYGSILASSGFTDDVDIIIPVPLHPAKERKRGFNQSKLIAEGLAHATGITIEDKVLRRAEKSLTQTRKSRVERWENVEGIFETRDERCIAGKHILLVDDVITTGATIEACALSLSKIEGVRVSVAALATAVQ